ncbi:hypothetical protein V1281_004574 [Nitrobacteraceae bacterium AZCC 2161]
MHAKVGRASVVLLSIDSNEALHLYLNEWADVIPPRFDIHALIDPAAAKTCLASHADRTG